VNGSFAAVPRHVNRVFTRVCIPELFRESAWMTFTRQQSRAYSDEEISFVFSKLSPRTIAGILDVALLYYHPLKNEDKVD
jgi:hypothetical protein